MEYADGGSLQEILRRRGPIPESYVAAICKDLLLALRHFHARRRIHRDLKRNFHLAANILFTSDGKIKLADFGVAGKISDSHCETFIGTPYWLAPEVAS